MLNSIKLRIQNYVCESHDNCALTYVLKAKEESDKKLSILQHKEEGITFIKNTGSVLLKQKDVNTLNML